MPTDAEKLAAASVRLSINLPPRREAAAMARRAISHALSQWGLGHITDTATLLVSELIANSVRHARTGTAPLELTAAVAGNRLRIEVSDADPRTPMMRRPSGLGEGGFGLVLVQALTGDWGVRQTANRKTVWLEIPAQARRQHSTLPATGTFQTKSTPGRIHAMTTYQATTPPANTTCDMRGCGSAADVRVIVPKVRFEADGADHSRDPGTWDSCDLHWPRYRDAVMRNGHEVVDTTGDLHRLAADFAGWTIFKSDGGRLYAASHGMTLYGWLVGPLRAEMQRVMEQASA